MPRHDSLLAASALLVLVHAALFTAPALAQDSQGAQEVLPAATQVDTEAEGRLFVGNLQIQPPLAAQEAQTLPAPMASAAPLTMRQPAWFMAVHAATATVQMLDAHSTIGALNNGAREVNPLARAFTNNHKGFVALKAGVAAGLIWGTGSMAKSHPVRALLVAAAINSAYATLVAHNYGVARAASR